MKIKFLKAKVAVLSIIAAFIGLAFAPLNAFAQNNNAPVMPLAVSVPFDEAAAKAGLEIGDKTVSGVLYSQTYYWGEDSPRFGAYYQVPRVNQTGQKIYIYPYTPYLEEFQRQVKRARNPRSTRNYKVVTDPRLYQYSVYATTDANGRFVFPKMKPGRYFLYSEKTLTGTVNKSIDTGGRTIQNHPYEGTTVTRHHELREVNWARSAIYEGIIEIRPRDTSIEIEARMKINPDR